MFVLADDGNLFDQVNCHSYRGGGGEGDDDDVDDYDDWDMISRLLLEYHTGRSRLTKL